jgi:hypothetical protein
MRLGLKGRAVYRWERDDSAPTKRHRAALVTAIAAVNQEAARELALAFNPELTKPAAPAPPPVDKGEAFDLAVFRMADELDLPPRRLRRPLGRLLKRLGALEVSLQDALQRIETSLAEELE